MEFQVGKDAFTNHFAKTNRRETFVDRRMRGDDSVSNRLPHDEDARHEIVRFPK